MDISIDLHLHFDGSLSVSTVRRLAEMQGIELPDDNAIRELLTVSDGCKDLAEYLTKFDFPLSLLQTTEAISEAMFMLCQELLTEGTMYAEIRFAPQLHLQKGLTQEKVVKAAVDGFEQSALMGGLILCCMRGADNHALNVDTVEAAEKFLGKGVLALDLAGNEAAYPNKSFADLFEKAKEKGIPYTIHAGEAAGADSVATALEMGAQRIGHGVRSIENESVLKLLSDKKIPIEICPTSNLNTAIFSDISEYPLRKLLEAGVVVTVNSDNRSVSNTTAKKEMALLKNEFGLTDGEIQQLLINSVNAAFCGNDTKEMLLKTIKNKAQL